MTLGQKIEQILTGRFKLITCPGFDLGEINGLT